MITHVVMMKFKSEVSAAAIDALERELHGLPDRIVEIQTYEFGRDLLGSERSFDFALVSLFANLEALKRYDTHPDHLRIKKTIGAMCSRIHTVDFDTTERNFAEKGPFPGI